MRKQLTLSITLAVFASYLHAQTPITVAENTVKVSSTQEEVFYYGFAEGDQLIFDLEVQNGKELSVLEIVSMPSKTIFMDYKTQKIDHKVLNITETGIYKFRLVNSNLFAGRVCKFKIERIPASEATRRFNTTVYNRTRYDTTKYSETVRFFIKSDTTVRDILDKDIEVHALLSSKPSKEVVNIALPTSTIAWAYYIGVGEDGRKTYKEATYALRSNINRTANRAVANTPLAALVLGENSYLQYLSGGDRINYSLTDAPNATLFLQGMPFQYFKKAKLANDFVRVPLAQTNLAFCFSNDNLLPTFVNVKVVALVVDGVYETMLVPRINVTPRQEMYLNN